MKLAFQQSFPAEPAIVLELLRNKEFLADVAEHAGARSHTASVDGERTLLAMELATPAKVQSVLGATIKVSLDMRFRQPAADGTVSGRVDVNVPGYPVEAFTTVSLAPGGEGTIGRYDGEMKVKIPLIGKKVESQVEPFVVAAFNGIERRARVWLTKA